MQSVLSFIMVVVLVITLLAVYVRNGWNKVIFNHIYFDSFKYQLGVSLYFFMNFILLVYCGLCGHCSSFCIVFTMGAVLIGAFIYIAHLGGQALFVVRQITSGNGFDSMPFVYSIPYIYLIYEIIHAIITSGLDSLHANESKMLIVLLYPFSVVMNELTIRIRKVTAGG